MGRIFSSILILTSVVLATNDCGRNKNSATGFLSFANTKSFSDQDVQFELEPVIPQEQNATTNPDAINVIPKGFTKNQKTGQLSLRADIDDQKNIDLVGMFAQGEARLYSTDKNIEAVAVCADDELCDQMIVTVYKKGKNGHQQFITPFHSDHLEALSDIQGPSGDSNVEEDDEGLGVDEYVVPQPTFALNSMTPDSNKNTSNQSRALGPHARTQDKKTGKLIYGKLLNGVMFPFFGPGFMLRNRENIWTTETLIKLITQVGAEMAAIPDFSKRPPLEIGNISKMAGGYFAPHVSHENGLDIDIAYPAKILRQTSRWEEMSNGIDVNPNFDIERFWFISKKLVELSDVPFIFVTPAIKIAVCKYVKSKNYYSENINSSSFKALLAMRPPYADPKSGRPEDHRNHFHVREQCPSWMDGCLKARIPPTTEGTGCPLTI